MSQIGGVIAGTLPTEKPRLVGWRTIALAAALLVLAPAAFGGGALLPAWITLFGLLCLPYERAGALLVRHWPKLAFVAALAGWAAWTVTWSPYGRFDQAWKLAGCLIFGMAFVLAASGPTEADRVVVRRFAVFMVILMIALGAVEAVTGLALNRLAQPDADFGMLQRNPGKGASILVLCAWGAAAALAGGGRWVGFAVVLLGAAAVSTQFGMEANAVAFAAGALAAPIAAAAPRVMLPLMTAGLAGWLVAAPFVLPRVGDLPIVDQLPLSWGMRTEIWAFAGERIWEKPWFGWGLDAARTFKDTLIDYKHLTFSAIPLHPHSGALHLWLEVGLVGVALVAAGLVWIGWAVGRALARDRWTAAAAGGLIASAGVIANISYGVWQEWWLTAVALGAALVAAARRAPETDEAQA